MRLSPRDRVLVLAPHPDDETLGAGGLLQRALAAGASCRVVFATDGDDNPWPQRVLERRLRLGGAARARWGARRRSEAYAALDALRVPRRCAVFLGFPDRGLTRLLLSAPGEVTRRLAAEIAEWTPTVVVMPSLRDRHPDHSALAVLALETLDGCAGNTPPAILTYVVHPLGAAPPPDAWHVELTREERARKRLAIDRHATQLVFHRRSYRRAVAGAEWFGTITTAARAAVRCAIADAVVDDGVLRIGLAARVPFPCAILSIVGWDAALRPFTLRAVLSPAQRTLAVRDPHSGAVVSRGFRAPGSIDVLLPRGRALRRVFVKLVAPPVLFDGDGWTCAVARALDGVSPERSGRPRRVDTDRRADALERHLPAWL